MSVPWRWLKGGWVLTPPLPRAVPRFVVSLLCLPAPCLFIWHIGNSRQSWHVESRRVGLGSKTPVPVLRMWVCRRPGSGEQSRPQEENMNGIMATRAMGRPGSSRRLWGSHTSVSHTGAARWPWGLFEQVTGHHPKSVVEPDNLHFYCASSWCQHYRSREHLLRLLFYCTTAQEWNLWSHTTDMPLPVTWLLKVWPWTCGHAIRALPSSSWRLRFFICHIKKVAVLASRGVLKRFNEIKMFRGMPSV
jgi:hypothetical protein